MNKLNGVEIFATGKHNGDSYTEQDIDDMISAFSELDYQPALKLGHDDAPGAPAVGYISRLWKDGQKLMADFVDIPEKVMGAIKEKMFNRVSAEIYWNLERNGKKYRRALKALALLGAQVPGVAGLKPLAELFSGNQGEVKSATESHFAIDDSAASAANKDESQSKDDKMTAEDQAKLDDLQSRFAAVEAGLAEEKKLREVAEKKLAEALEAGNKGGGSADISAAIKNLSGDQQIQKIAELSEGLAKLETALTAEKAAREAAERQAAEHDTRVKQLAEDSRKSSIERLAETCRIPMLRTYIRQFADLATRSTDVKVYDAENKESLAMVELEKFIQYCNTNAQRIFSVVSTEDPLRKSATNAGEEVDRRAKLYMAQNKGVDYGAACRAVLDADATLKAEYAKAAA